MRSSFRQHSLCLRCAFRIEQRRSYASTSAPIVTAPIPNRAFIELEGLDTVPFLQGLTTNSIKIPNVKSSRPIYTAFLNAQGRVLYDAYIWPPAKERGREGWLVEMDERDSQSLVKHLKKHKLRSKIQIRLLEKDALKAFSRFRLDESSEQVVQGGTDMSLQQELDELVQDQLGLSSDMNTLSRPSGLRFISVADARNFVLHSQSPKLSLAYQVHRMVNGLPEGPDEIIRESALPQESNMDLLGGIDFRKGCYLGQELTIRTHHTGVIRKRILPVQLYSTEEQLLTHVNSPMLRRDSQLVLPPSGANISKAGGTRGRSAGKWLRGVGNVGLALCRLEMMTDIRLTEESSPYNPKQEFRVTWEADGDRPAGEVKLKAFVPQWMRDGISAGFRSHSRKQQPDLEKNLDADMPDTDEELTSPHGAFAVRDT